MQSTTISNAARRLQIRPVSPDQNRLTQFEFGIRHEHLPDREKGKRHSRSFFERKLGWHQKAVAGLNAHVLGIRAAFPLSHQAQAGAQVLAIGQTKFTNVAAGGG